MSIFKQFLQFGDGASDAVMVDNADWLDQLGYLDFCEMSVGTSVLIAC